MCSLARCVGNGARYRPATPALPSDLGAAGALDKLVAEKTLWGLHGFLIVPRAGGSCWSALISKAKNEALGPIGSASCSSLIRRCCYTSTSRREHRRALLRHCALRKVKSSPPSAPLNAHFPPEYQDLVAEDDGAAAYNRAGVVDVRSAHNGTILALPMTAPPMTIS